MLPPSVHPETQKQYAWIEGGPETLPDLPQVRPGSLPLLGDTTAPSIGAEPELQGFHHQRNKTLFAEARRFAFDCNSYEDFEARLLGINASLFKNAVDGPQPEAEVKAQAKAIWRYRELGRLVPLGQSYALAHGHEIDLLVTESVDAFALLMWLRKANLGRNKTFPISSTGLAPILKWGKERVFKARRVLQANKLIVPRSRANPRQRIASLYAFPDPLIPESGHYIKEIPPVCLVPENLEQEIE